MEESPLHRIEDDLAETWLEDWAGAGIAEMEEYLKKQDESLKKHAAFLVFLAERDVQADQE